VSAAAALGLQELSGMIRDAGQLPDSSVVEIGTANVTVGATT